MRIRLECPTHGSYGNDNEIADNRAQIVSKDIDVNKGAATTSM